MCLLWYIVLSVCRTRYAKKLKVNDTHTIFAYTHKSNRTIHHHTEHRHSVHQSGEVAMVVISTSMDDSRLAVIVSHELWEELVGE